GDIVDDAVDLVDADEGTLKANDPAPHHVEEVAITDQAFRAILVQNRARVDLRCDLIGDPRREIGFDQSGDHIHGRTLRGQDEVNPDGAGHLCEPCDRPFDLLTGRHHQVGQLIHDHDDIGKVDEAILRAQLLLLYLLVVLFDAADSCFGEEIIPDLHFSLAALQHAEGFIKVRDDGVAAVLRHRNEVICDGLVLLQFDLFWIDHHELQIGRMARVQEPGDKRIQPDRLARASGAGNQQVRELGEVLHEDLPLDGLADGDGQLHFRIAEARRTNYIPNLNQLPVTVGDLHADRRLPRDGRNHPDAFGRH